MASLEEMSNLVSVLKEDAAAKKASQSEQAEVKKPEEKAEEKPVEKEVVEEKQMAK